jgi:hypothetical protein
MASLKIKADPEKLDRGFFYARTCSVTLFFDSKTKKKVSSKKKSFSWLLFRGKEKASKNPPHYYSKFVAKVNS